MSPFLERVTMIVVVMLLSVVNGLGLLGPWSEFDDVLLYDNIMVGVTVHLLIGVLMVVFLWYVPAGLGKHREKWTWPHWNAPLGDWENPIPVLHFASLLVGTGGTVTILIGLCVGRVPAAMECYALAITAAVFGTLRYFLWRYADSLPPRKKV